MIPIIVTLRATDRRIKPHEVEGFVPWETCPLAVVPSFSHSTKEGWEPVKGEWVITHRATGFHLGRTFDSKEIAERVLQSSQPTFPAWLMANGFAGDVATSACRAIFRAALIANGLDVPDTVAA